MPQSTIMSSSGTTWTPGLLVLDVPVGKDDTTYVYVSECQKLECKDSPLTTTPDWELQESCPLNHIRVAKFEIDEFAGSSWSGYSKMVNGLLWRF